MIEKRSSGFSLLELIIVLVIVSMVLLLVSPTLTKTIHHMELKSTAKKISAMLRACRSGAASQGKICLAEFNMDSRLVTIYQAAKGEEGLTVERSYPLPTDVQMDKVETGKTMLDVAPPSFEFYPNGGSNGGVATIRGRGGLGYSIHVDGLTGTVRIEGLESR